MADPAPNLAENTESPMTEAKPESTELATEEPPSAEKLRKIEDYIVLDKEGNKHTFKSLYAGPESTACVLVVFIRHFFCGVSSLCPFHNILVYLTDVHQTRVAKSSFVHLQKL
jgi:hypothetical protein